MTEGVGPMIRSNGASGRQQVYINVARTGQNGSQNESYYRIIVQYRGNGSTAWASDNANQWSASSGPFAWQGTFPIPYGSGGATITLLDTTFTRKHDANGNDSVFNSRADISSYNREYIGAGSVTISEPPIPRIPKKPSPPGKPTFSKIDGDTVTVSWTASTDNGGAPIDAYLLRYWPNAEGSGNYTDHSTANNLTRTVTGLQPGKKYRFVVYAHNGSADNSGFSLPSPANVVELFVGVRVKVNGKWRFAIPYVKVEGKWKRTLPFVRRNGKWFKAG